jgi:hypothetical protein
MSSDVSNLSDTIIPKSDQLNADSLLSGPITIRITSVTRGTDDQPVVVGYRGDNGRPWKPGKSSRKVLIFAWGEDGAAWVGKSATIYNNPNVKFGGVAVGGIRISHLSHIPKDIVLSLNATRGKKESVTIKRLEVTTIEPSPELVAAMTAAATNGIDALRAAFAPLTEAEKEALLSKVGLMDALKERANNSTTTESKKE